jgi:Sulfotransferase family
MAPKVVFIAGYSRSGSTLLDRMLGELPGFVSTGELAYLWTRGLQQNRLCGCGAKFRDCAFWERVGVSAFGGWNQLDIEHVARLRQEVLRHRYAHLLLEPRLSRPFELKLRSFAELMARLYTSIAAVSGARVIVDSTVDAPYGFLLRHVPDIDVRTVHLVRDSRATAFSWTKRVPRADYLEESTFLPTFHPAETALRWTADHLLVHLLAKLGGGALLVRYEDLVADPRAKLNRVAHYAGGAVQGADPTFVGAGSVELGLNHTVAGSRMRLQRGTGPLRLDDDWRGRLPRGHRLAVTALSLPLLVGYGYLAPAAGWRGPLQALARSEPDPAVAPPAPQAPRTSGGF